MEWQQAEVSEIALGYWVLNQVTVGTSKSCYLFLENIGMWYMFWLHNVVQLSKFALLTER